MTVLSPPARKALLSVHLTASVGWIGAVVGYLALGIWAVRTEDATAIRSAWSAMEVTGWYAIVPLASVSFVTGVVLALVTRWGLFRHYWVVFSLVATAFATVVLLLHMPTVGRTADAARELEGEELRALGGDLFHPGVGLVVLLCVQVLNIFKPAGLTRYGWRRQREEKSGGAGARA